jgi:hypothetical protein
MRIAQALGDKAPTALQKWLLQHITPLKKRRSSSGSASLDRPTCSSSGTTSCAAETSGGAVRRPESSRRRLGRDVDRLAGQGLADAIAPRWKRRERSSATS